MGRGGRRCAGILLLALTVASCSGDDNDASADAPSTTTTTIPPPSTTVAPESTTTTTLPLFSFDDSVPAPELQTTGEDFDAIYRSIDAYSTWLLAHRPDVELVREISPEGTQQYAATVGDVELLARQGLRNYTTGAQVESVSVVDRVAEVATLRVVYAPGEDFLVREDGEVTDRQLFPGADAIMVLSADGAGRWRLVSTDPVNDSDVEI